MPRASPSLGERPRNGGEGGFGVADAVIRRKVVTRVIVLVLLISGGAIVNVAVAWGFAWFQDSMPISMAPFPEGRSHPDGIAWHLYYLGQTGTELVLIIPADRAAPPRPPRDAHASARMAHMELMQEWQASGQSFASSFEFLPPPYWSRANSRPPVSEIGYDEIAEEARGWPLRALMCEVSWEHDATTRMRVGSMQEARGWPLRALMCEVSWEHDATTRMRVGSMQQQWAIPLGGTQGPMAVPRRLPLKPVWPGFAINTILYAAALWLVFCAGPGFVRRRIRRRRGQCLHCGYDLRGQPGAETGASAKCPECGNPDTLNNLNRNKNETER